VRQGSNWSTLSSKESADDSVASPNWVSIDIDAALQHGKGSVTSDGPQAMRWSPGKDAAPPLSAGAAAVKRRSSNHGPVRPSSTTDGSSPDAAAAAAGTSAEAAVSAWGCPDGWLWHCGNPVKVLTCQEAPLLCCAWIKGAELPKLVVGSAAGWLVVVSCEGQDMEECMVSRRTVGIARR
jgi:hypothetical protein